MRKKFAPGKGEEISDTSKNTNPDCVLWGSTALAPNRAASISSSAFLLTAPFTFFVGIGSGDGIVARCGFDNRRYKSSVVAAFSLLRFAVTSWVLISGSEIGWSPSF